MRNTPIRDGRGLSLSLLLGFLVTSAVEGAGVADGDIRGRAINQATGLPLAGVTVSVSGAELAAKSDLDGLFTSPACPRAPTTLPRARRDSSH